MNECATTLLLDLVYCLVYPSNLIDCGQSWIQFLHNDLKYMVTAKLTVTLNPASEFSFSFHRPAMYGNLTVL